MENPATWNEATKIIDAAIAKFQKQIDSNVYGLSLAIIIHDELSENGYLVHYSWRYKIMKLETALDRILEDINEIKS